jgi:hypothetical protein
MRAARTLEADGGKFCGEVWEDESSTERVCAAGFHVVMACSRLAGVLKLTSLTLSHTNFLAN